jgi:phage FluMu protein Com
MIKDQNKDLNVFCGHCGAYLGKYPSGVEIICPVCKWRNFPPGLETITEGLPEEAKKLDEKQAKERYTALRER